MTEELFDPVEVNAGQSKPGTKCPAQIMESEIVDSSLATSLFKAFPNGLEGLSGL